MSWQESPNIKHNVTLGNAARKDTKISDVRIGEYFTSPKFEGVLLMIWHDKDKEAYSFVSLERPSQTWSGNRDSHVVGDPATVLPAGTTINITVAAEK
jgi:hypothetical protein